MSKNSEPSAPVFRLPYDELQFKISDFTGLKCEEGSSLAHQSFKEECDVNFIVNNLDTNGFLDTSRGSMPQFVDATLYTDFHEAQNIVASGTQIFEALPADVRFRFHNDPGEFMDFVADPDNTQEAIKMGLATPKVPIDPSPAEGVSNPPANQSDASGSDS
ncbi:MAG: internal scaffolding protein [Microviridae sp.]|nr:MAG: internal scaffolding protein [Microviridae sp.]